MSPLRSMFATALSLALLPAVIQAHTQAPDAHLAAVLAQMDAASQRFTNAQADFSRDNYQAVVKDTSTDTGSVYFLRKNNATQMGAVLFNPGSKAKKTVYEYKDGLLKLLDVSNDQIRIIKPDANHGQVETFLTLGFGGSGKDLARAWNITDQGTETLTDLGQPVKTEKLDLVSKDPNVSKTFTHVTIWVDPARGVSLKQMFETTSHDRQTTTYSHIKLNTRIDTNFFEIPSKNAAGKKLTVVGP